MSDIDSNLRSWNICEEIGRGSFGRVYRAVKREKDRTLFAAVKAVKISDTEDERLKLSQEGMSNSEISEYLTGAKEEALREIKLLRCFEMCENIVTLYDSKVLTKDEGKTTQIYMISELLTPISRCGYEELREENKVLRLGIHICNALEICRRNHIIHRDIKPQNVFVDADWNFKLGDFGTALDMDDTLQRPTVRGTYYYMAPEMALDKEYDYRADLYSLGMLMYQLLNENKLPMAEKEVKFLSDDERYSIIKRRLKGEKLPYPSQSEKPLGDIVLKACAYNPEDRFVSASQMKETLLSLYKFRG